MNGSLVYCCTGAEHWTLNYEDPDLNPPLSCKSLGNFLTLHCPSSLSCMKEYLAIESGEDMRTSILRELIAAWLYASQRSQDGIQLKLSARHSFM